MYVTNDLHLSHMRDNTLHSTQNVLPLLLIAGTSVGRCLDSFSKSKTEKEYSPLPSSNATTPGVPMLHHLSPIYKGKSDFVPQRSASYLKEYEVCLSRVSFQFDTAKYCPC